jgi:uncharacterized membrane protein
MLCTTGWMLWAYLRLRPPHSVTSTRVPLSGYGPWSYSHLAYSDILSLYRVHHLANHAFPYVHTVIEYPVLTGLFMWSAAWFPGVGGYFLASCVGLWLFALGSVVLLHRISPRSAWVFSLCPLLLVYSLLNWDLMAIFLTLAGWDFFRRRRYAWAGVLLTLGVCAKFFPIMLLVFCIVTSLADREHQGARRGAAVMVAASAVTAVVVNVPFAIANFAGWDDFFSFNASRGGEGGLLFQLHLVSDWSVSAVNALSVVLVLAAVALLAWWVWRGAPTMLAAAAAFAFFMLLNKVFSPQYMLWVFVFGLLALWPGWTLAAVTVAGLIDFTNAMITLHLLAVHSPSWPWYFQTVYPLNRALRSTAIACGTVASVWLAWRAPTARWRLSMSGPSRHRALASERDAALPRALD